MEVGDQTQSGEWATRVDMYYMYRTHVYIRACAITVTNINLVDTLYFHLANSEHIICRLWWKLLAPIPDRFK